MTNNHTIIDWDNSSNLDQDKLISLYRKFKWQITYQLPNERVRYMYCNEPGPSETYLKFLCAKILKVEKIKQK